MTPAPADSPDPARAADDVGSAGAAGAGADAARAGLAGAMGSAGAVGNDGAARSAGAAHAAGTGREAGAVRVGSVGAITSAGAAGNGDPARAASNGGGARAAVPAYGVGIGWRPEIAGFVAGLPGLRFVEVVAESVGAELDPALAALRARDVAVVPHGVRLSLGGAEPVDPHRVGPLVSAAALLDAPLVSEHIAFVRAGGVEAGHLLPLPRSREAVDAVVANVRRVQAELSVPIALEPIAAIFDWPDDELDEAAFLTEILDRTDALLLLDVANVYANAANRGTDPVDLLDRLPLERIAYCHVAGGASHDGIYHDTHTDAVPPEVLDLVAALTERHQPPALMLERDGHYPPADDLRAELDAIAAASGHPRVT